LKLVAKFGVQLASARSGRVVRSVDHRAESDELLLQLRRPGLWLGRAVVRQHGLDFSERLTHRRCGSGDTWVIVVLEARFPTLRLLADLANEIERLVDTREIVADGGLE